MNPDLYGLIELILVFGIVVGLAFWQLYVLERDKKAAKKPDFVSRSAEQDERNR